MRHKEFAQPINVVIIVKRNLKTGAWARVILFSSDLDLAWDMLLDYYRLRFQLVMKLKLTNDLLHIVAKAIQIRGKVGFDMTRGIVQFLQGEGGRIVRGSL